MYLFMYITNIPNMSKVCNTVFHNIYEYLNPPSLYTFFMRVTQKGNTSPTSFLLDVAAKLLIC